MSVGLAGPRLRFRARRGLQPLLLSALGDVTRRLRFRVRDDEAGMRLDLLLAAHAPGLSRGAVRKLIDRGAAYVERRRLKRASHPVRAGDEVELYLPEERSAPPPASAPRVVHEDAEAIVIDKPAGMAVQARREGDAGTLEWWVRRRRREAEPRVRIYVAVVHRLDQPASGLVVLALRPRAAAALSRAFAAHAPSRHYLAVVSGAPAEDERWIDLPLATAGRKAVVDPARGRPARSHLRVLTRTPVRSLVEVRLETGRTHQIRAHLAAIGHPIVGDRLYGGEPFARLALHAAALAFDDPATGARRAFESPLPAELSVLLQEG
jgi:23S rRNA pseudouridine1911/1915/1917 synthase